MAGKKYGHSGHHWTRILARYFYTVFCNDIAHILDLALGVK